jgi:hypothetical protein
MKIVNFVLKSDFRISLVILALVMLGTCLGKNSNLDSDSVVLSESAAAKVVNPNSEEVISYDDSMFIVITVLDVNQDTICLNEKFMLDSLGLRMFKGKDTLIMSFDEYMKIEPRIQQFDMMTIRNCYGIVHMGQLAVVKKAFRERGMVKAKNDFVSNINWEKVSANYISCKPILWGVVYGDEFFDAYSSALKRKLSWAEFYMHWDNNEGDEKIARKYLRSSRDSLFKKEEDPDEYTLSWGYEAQSFRIVDLNMVMDWDKDGYADRMLRWYAQHGSGVCRVTRRADGKQIEFFELDFETR